MPIEIIHSSSNDGSKYRFMDKTFIHSGELPVLKHVASAMPMLGEGNFSIYTVTEAVKLGVPTRDEIVEVVVEGEGNPYIFWTLTEDTEHYLENCSHCPIGRKVPDLDCALKKAWNNFRFDTYRQDGIVAKWESMTNPGGQKAANS